MHAFVNDFTVEKLASPHLQASQGGKEIFIKAVAQSLPTYIMSIFKLPTAVCDDLTRMVRNF